MSKNLKVGKETKFEQLPVLTFRGERIEYPGVKTSDIVLAAFVFVMMIVLPVNVVNFVNRKPNNSATAGSYDIATDWEEGSATVLDCAEIAAVCPTNSSEQVSSSANDGGNSVSVTGNGASNNGSANVVTTSNNSIGNVGGSSAGSNGGGAENNNSGANGNLGEGYGGVENGSPNGDNNSGASDNNQGVNNNGGANNAHEDKKPSMTIHGGSAQWGDGNNDVETPWHGGDEEADKMPQGTTDVTDDGSGTTDAGVTDDAANESVE